MHKRLIGPISLKVVYEVIPVFQNNIYVKRKRRALAALIIASLAIKKTQQRKRKQRTECTKPIKKI